MLATPLRLVSMRRLLELNRETKNFSRYARNLHLMEARLCLTFSWPGNAYLYEVFLKLHCNQLHRLHTEKANGMYNTGSWLAHAVDLYP